DLRDPLVDRLALVDVELGAALGEERVHLLRAVSTRVVLAAGEEGAHHQAVGVGLAQEGRLAQLELLVAIHLLDPGGELELGQLDVYATSLERLLADLGDLDWLREV